MALSTFDLEDDATARRLVYTSAFLMIFYPLLQTVTQLGQLHFGDIKWRIAVSGAFSAVVLFPYLGSVLALVTARATSARGIARLVGIFSVLMALASIVALLVFIMDALQFKTIITTEAEMTAFTMGSLRIGIIYTLFAVLFVMLAVISFRVRRGPVVAAPRPAATTRKVADSGLIVGQEG